MNDIRHSVLVVDDDPSIRKLMRMYLDEHYRVAGEASNGHEAIALVRELRPDVVVTDLTMPGMGGTELSRRLEAEHSGTSVVVASASSDLDSLREAMASGARDYLIKPIEQEDLLACLDRVLAQRTARAQAQAKAVKRGERAPAAGTWVFTGPKDGGGQTTVLLALANELAVQEHAVVVVDADLLFGDVAFHLGLSASHPDLADLLTGDDYLEVETIDRHLVRHESGLRILCAPEDPSKSNLVDTTRLAALAGALEERFDYVLVDLPFGTDEAVARLFDRARLIFEISAGDPTRIRHLRSIHSILLKLGYPAEKLYPIVTRIDSGQGAEWLKQIRAGQGASLPSDDEACLEALRRGQPITRVMPRSPLPLALRELVAPILGSPPPVRSGLPEFLHRLFG